MVGKKKTIANISDNLIFLYFVIFPFGQLLRFSINFGGLPITIHVIDVIIAISALVFIYNGGYKKIHNKYWSFFLVAIFSLLVSFSQFSIIQVMSGSLYLVRLIFHFIFLFFVVGYIGKDKSKKELLLGGLITISVFTALFGWVQYFLYPDLRFLKFIGWDDHLNRLVGTFLDPIFTGLIIVFGFLLSLNKYLKNKEKRYLHILVFLAASLAFTYSRASYLALFTGLAAYFSFKNIKYLFLIFTLFLVILVLLPRTEGEGVRLERTSSVIARLYSYKQTLYIFEKQPLFGVGFNNLCNARNEIKSSQLHSCAGSDSSLLLVAATTGIVGLLVFINTIYLLSLNLVKSKDRKIVLSVSVSLMIHSFFANSLFYPWVLSYFLILLALNYKNSREYT